MQPSTIDAFVSAFELTGRTAPAILRESSALAILRGRTDVYLESLADARDTGVPGAFVFEPAGASFRISETRVLAERAFSLSGGDAREYFFVARAETLTVDAANSLLKILEDVPAGICFLLVSEYPERILATVRSRCLELDSASDSVPPAVLDSEVIRRIDAYLAGSRAALLVHLAGATYERADALVLLAGAMTRMGATGRVDAELADALSRGMDELSNTTVSPRNILDRIFLVR